MDQVTLFKTHYEAIKTLSPEARTEVYDAIFGHLFDNIEQRLSTQAFGIFLLVLRDIEAQNAVAKKTKRRPGAKGGEDGGEATPSSRFIPPTIEEVAAYCQERKNKIDPQYFHDSYASKGWMVGKTKMKDWKASVRTWERNDCNAFPSKAKENPGGSAIDAKIIQAFMEGSGE